MQTRHFLQLIFMSALWGGSFPLLRIASPALGPWLLAALVLTLLMRALREQWPPNAAWLRLGLLGLLTVAAPFVLFSWAALVIPAGYSAVLNATAPLFGVLGAAAAQEERLTARRLLGCAVGFAGVALLVQLGPVAVTPRVLLATGLHRYSGRLRFWCHPDETRHPGAWAAARVGSGACGSDTYVAAALCGSRA